MAAQEQPQQQQRRRGVALVTGATGLVGRYLVMQLLRSGAWKVYAVSRAAHLNLEELDPDDEAWANLHHVQVASLLDRKLVGYEMRDLDDVTHIFHCAFHTSKDDQAADVVTNLTMLTNVVEAIEANQAPAAAAEGPPAAEDASPADGKPGGAGAGSPTTAAATPPSAAAGPLPPVAEDAAGPSRPQARLQHVYVQAGSKWYGQHLGKYKTPAKETDPRYLTPNFYYDLVDYCMGRVEAGAGWTWSALLPNPVIGYSPGSFMNLLNCVAAYAVVCRQLGLPFRFPGPDAAYDALTECCDAQLLAEAIEFVSTIPEAANKFFNVSNGDVFRWSEVWPQIGKLVGLEVAPPQAVCLTDLMALPDKRQAWRAALREAGLADKPEVADYDRLVAWTFADFCFGKPYDFFQSVTKLRQVDFTGMKLDTADMWLAWLQHLDTKRLIPPITAASAAAAAGAAETSWAGQQGGERKGGEAAAAAAAAAPAGPDAACRPASWQK